MPPVHLVTALLALVLLSGCLGSAERIDAPRADAEQAPPVKAIPIDINGSMLFGACAMNVPGLARDGACWNLNPNRTLLNAPIEPNMTATRLGVEWDAESTLSERLAFTVGAVECHRHDCDYTVFYWKAGTSPLEWSTDNLTAEAPAGWILFAHVHYTPIVEDPVWISAGGFGQKFHIFGQIQQDPGS